MPELSGLGQDPGLELDDPHILGLALRAGQTGLTFGCGLTVSLHCPMKVGGQDHSDLPSAADNPQHPNGGMLPTSTTDPPNGS